MTHPQRMESRDINSIITDVNWINHTPRRYRIQMAREVFPDLSWLVVPDDFIDIGSSTIGWYCNHFRLRVYNTIVYIRFGELRGKYISIKDLPEHPDKFTLIVIENGIKQGFRPEYDLYGVLRWKQVSDSMHGYINNGCLQYTPCSNLLHGTRRDHTCSECRKLKHEMTMLQHSADKIYSCIYAVTCEDILKGLQKLLNRSAKFTFLCIWYLRWSETGFQRPPLDVLKMIIARL
jgi:hypothetical protein